MSGEKSRNKGANFERHIAKVLSEAYSVPLRRTPLSGGWAQDSPVAAGDMVCTDPDLIFPFCVECKNAEGWRLESMFTDNHAWFDTWWRQVVEECPDDKHPLLVFSRNRCPTFVVASSVDIMQGMPYPRLVVKVDGELVTIALLEDFLKWEAENED